MQFVCEHGHERGIAGSATGHDEVTISAFSFQYESSKSICDGLRCQRRRGSNDIALVRTPAAADEFVGKLASKFFSPRCLRRLATKKWHSQNITNYLIKNSAGA